MIKTKVLSPDPRYDAAGQARVASFAAQLDDQLQLLEREVGELGPDELSWQLGPGFNTIGMLVVHLAVAEAWWLVGIAAGVPRATRAEAIEALLGMHPRDDGIPLKPDGAPPAGLAGKGVQDLLEVVRVCRARTHEILAGWTDASLAEEAVDAHRDVERRCSREWILYHLVEHFAAHLGQVGLLKHALRARSG